MTYSTTPIICAYAERAGLKLRKPLRPMPGLVRRVYVTEDIARFLDGDNASSHFPQAGAEATLTRFLAGYSITVGDQKRRRRKAEQPILERLEGLDEVWALCFRVPPPGWRLLGRFLAKDIFVGLALWDKHELAGQYDKAAAEVIETWNALFDLKPLRAPSFDDYLENWTNLDDDR